MRVYILTESKPKFLRDYPRTVKEQCLFVQSPYDCLRGVGIGGAIVITKIYEPNEQIC